MVKWSKKEIVICVVLLSFCVLIPIIIHILYKMDFGIEFFYSTWNSGDILQYCGAVLSSIIAMIGIYLTLKGNRDSELSKKVLENKPYFRTNLVQFRNLQEKESLYENGNILCVWGVEGCNSYDLHNYNGKHSFLEFFEHNNVDNDYITIFYEIENIGLGNAINFSLRLNDSRFFPKKVICKEEKICIYFLVEKQLFKSDAKEFWFDLTFEDVIKVNIYNQTERFYISYDKETNSIIYQRDFRDELTEPKSIEKKIFL